jgi:pimeloyl-ACP methyl ester carboxylesterase
MCFITTHSASCRDWTVEVVRKTLFESDTLNVGLVDSRPVSDACGDIEWLTSLVLTNCDVHDGWPPPQVLPLMEHSRNGTLAPVFQPTLDRPDLARERYAKGESVPLFRSYADPGVLTDEVIRLYLQPLLASKQRIEAFERCWLGFDKLQTVAIHSMLKTLEVPTLIVWGLEDIFFDKKWAYWLKDTIPGAKRVVEVEDARLFFAEDHPDALASRSSNSGMNCSRDEPPLVNCQCHDAQMTVRPRHRTMLLPSLDCHTLLRDFP